MAQRWSCHLPFVPAAAAAAVQRFYEMQAHQMAQLYSWHEMNCINPVSLLLLLLLS
jgi:hypothetical protein